MRHLPVVNCYISQVSCFSSSRLWTESEHWWAFLERRGHENFSTFDVIVVTEGSSPLQPSPSETEGLTLRRMKRSD